MLYILMNIQACMYIHMYMHIYPPAIYMYKINCSYHPVIYMYIETI